jgi:putative ABC transport system permease protein
VTPLDESIFGTTMQVLWTLLAGVGALLLIGCANAAGLLVARGLTRRREFAIRAAIGGGAGRLIAQVLTESLAIVVISAAAGLVLAHSGLRLLLALAPPDVPRLEQVSLDPSVILLMTGVTALTILLVGAAPAWLAGHTRSSDALRAGTRALVGRVAGKLETGLLAGQIVVTVVLLITAGLLLRTAVALQQTPIGFDPAQLLTFRLVLDEERYRGEEGQWIMLADIPERVRALPGVQRVSAVSHPPLVWGDSMLGFTVDDGSSGAGTNGAGVHDDGAMDDGSMNARSAREPRRAGDALRYSATPEYFRTLDIPLRAGRVFTARDAADAPPVAVVNEYLARKWLAGRNPVGARLRIAGQTRSVEIVGVVGDTRHYGLDTAMREQLYFPYAQSPSSSTTVIVKTALPAEAIVPAIRHVVSERDPEQAVSHVLTMPEAIGRKVARQQMSAALLSTFATLALALAGAGLFASVAHAVHQRTAEVGLRVALDARRIDVLTLVLGRGARGALLGVALGLLAAWPAAHQLGALLFGVTPNDPATFGIVTAIVLTLVLLACLGPARRALRVDPTIALRAD